MGNKNSKLIEDRDPDQPGVKESGTRRIPVGATKTAEKLPAGRYALGRKEVATEYPEIDPDLDLSAFAVPKVENSPLGVDLAGELAKAERELPDTVLIEIAQRVSMASDHPSAIIDQKTPTIVEPVIAHAKLRDADVDDDLEVGVLVNSDKLAEIIDIRSASRGKAIGIVERHGGPDNWPWWKCEDPLVRIWHHLNSGVQILPDWRVEKDLKVLLSAEELQGLYREYNGKKILVRASAEAALLKCYGLEIIERREAEAKAMASSEAQLKAK